MSPPQAASLPRPQVTTLAHGVRAVSLVLPHALTVNVSVFVRCGSAHEPRRLGGISHVIEHMLFKGTHTRDARRINLDAERLGTEVNAHTDKDHSAFHMHCRPRDLAACVRMLADIVQNPSFPEHELANERHVLLQEFAEDEDDPVAGAWRLFEKASWGTHGAAMPVIGTRRLLENVSRDELLRYHQEHFTGHNVVVAAAGPIDADKFSAEVQRCFASLQPGQPHAMPAPAWGGGVRVRGQAGSSQAHAVLGFPASGLQAQDVGPEVAAAVLGEGMSSPLMQRLREERGIVYYAACAADVMDGFGQFVIEASMAPQHLHDFVGEAVALLKLQTQALHRDDLARAQQQLALRQLRLLERPQRWLEQAALDVFVHGRPRAQHPWGRRVASMNAEALCAIFTQLMKQPATLAVTGRVPHGAKARAEDALARAGLGGSGSA
jgi:predicted Zn-dependent peptidase